MQLATCPHAGVPHDTALNQDYLELAMQIYLNEECNLTHERLQAQHINTVGPVFEELGPESIFG